MTLRTAEERDVALLAGLERDLFGPDAWSREQLREELLGEGRRVWVVGVPVYGYVVTSLAGEVADLLRIGVRPDRRRDGQATALLARAVQQAGADGAVRMLLEVAADNPGALALYARAGFVEIARRRRYYRSGADAVVMERPLPS